MNRVLAVALVVLLFLAMGLSTTAAQRQPAVAPTGAPPNAANGGGLRPTPTVIAAVVELIAPPTPKPDVFARAQLFGGSTALKPAKPVNTSDSTPSTRLVPDSELVNGPSAVDFDVRGFLAQRGGYINQYSERTIQGEQLTGAQIVMRVAQQFSVHPRLLIALLEYEGGWINSSAIGKSQVQYPYGNLDALRSGRLHLQMTWAAARLNEGYYGWRLGTRTFVQLGDKDSYANIPPSQNAGTAGVQNYLASVTPRAKWEKVMGDGDGSFLQEYKRMFGDPAQYDRGAPIPPATRQPKLRLPFTDGERWHLTGGPHSAWGTGSIWAALDFAPQNAGGCSPSVNWVVSMSDGAVARSVIGEVAVSLDSSKDERIGWSILYMHMAPGGRVEKGAQVRTGDHIGHPSCEGGQAMSAHLHTARKVNGEWVSASGDQPFVMDGWVAYETPGGEFQGALVKGDVVRQADESRNIDLNGVP